MKNAIYRARIFEPADAPWDGPAPGLSNGAIYPKKSIEKKKTAATFLQKKSPKLFESIASVIFKQEVYCMLQ